MLIKDFMFRGNAMGFFKQESGDLKTQIETECKTPIERMKSVMDASGRNTSDLLEGAQMLDVVTQVIANPNTLPKEAMNNQEATPQTPTPGAKEQLQALKQSRENAQEEKGAEETTSYGM
ncbi:MULTISPECIES: hypothetical protein [Legionella]|nr:MULTISPECIES: hypothetical protein [Legionella]MBN9226834.1 hypothetical protein [Legionella steelei]OJW06616.1 MAG: hypothetical protein BGO44_17640 [Legionella sp. 39-23]